MADESKALVEELLSIAGITINGDKPYDIQVLNEDLYERILRDEALGLGESYMDGWWEAESVDEFINRLLRAELDKKIKGNWKIKWHYLKSRLFNLQKGKRAFHVGKHHYDIGNDFFVAMLDKRMNYSCGYWKDADNLDDAQEAKLELICKKLELEPGMRVLDIGCGWGAFAKYASEKYKVEVIGVTVSKEQQNLAKELTKGLPVEIRFQDYREIKGEKFDRILSIGSFEHVGHKNYRKYMEIVDENLKDDGISLIHTIGSNISVTTANAWTTKYIFPNGNLPSIAQISKAMEGLFVIEDIHNFGPHYDKTLMAWYENFNKAWPKFKDKYGERFYRMWKYYLLSSAGGFRSRQTQLWQIVFTKPGRKQPQRVC